MQKVVKLLQVEMVKRKSNESIEFWPTDVLVDTTNNSLIICDYVTIDE